MARKVTWGTPGRTAHYLWPRGKWAFVLPAVVLGGGLLALLLLLQAAGVRRPLAPGDVISRHAPIEARCEECHTARRGVSLPQLELTVGESTDPTARAREVRPLRTPRPSWLG